MKKIAALLTVHNRRDKTLSSLKNLKSQKLSEDVSVDVYLTDDGCTDGTREAVSNQFPEVHVIDGDGSLFWNRGMYAAWQEASKVDYDYYLWLNDDTFLYDDAISRLLNESDSHDDKAVVVGSTCSTTDKSLITYGGWVKGKKLIDVSSPQKCETINGNIVLIPRFVYSKVGMNDPYFRHSAGDTDYGYRVIEAGLENWVAAGVYGECDLHDRKPIWCDPNMPLKARLKNLSSPTGCSIKELFYLYRRHFGILRGLRVVITTTLHVLFPKLWNLKSKS